MRTLTTAAGAVCLAVSCTPSAFAQNASDAYATNGSAATGDTAQDDNDYFP